MSIHPGIVLRPIPGSLLFTHGCSLTYLLKSGEKTLREVHERISADPRPIAKRLGFKNKLVIGLTLPPQVQKLLLLIIYWANL